MRRSLLLVVTLLVAAVPAAQPPAPPPFDLEEATIAQLQERMQSGRATARSLAAQYIARIEAVDRGGPALRSVLELNPDALDVADRLDAERSTRGPRGPLHGVPVLVDYWAPWCGPCRMVAPELEKVAARQSGRLLVVKVNTDELPDLGERFNIRSIPTLALFANGRELARAAGARQASDIEAWAQQAAHSMPQGAR